MDLRIRKLELSIHYDCLFWPYCMFRRMQEPGAQRYFGHKWFLIIHVLWWEIQILESA